MAFFNHKRTINLPYALDRIDRPVPVILPSAPPYLFNEDNETIYIRADRAQDKRVAYDRAMQADLGVEAEYEDFNIIKVFMKSTNQEMDWWDECTKNKAAIAYWKLSFA